MADPEPVGHLFLNPAPVKASCCRMPCLNRVVLILLLGGLLLAGCQSAPPAKSLQRY